MKFTTVFFILSQQCNTSVQIRKKVDTFSRKNAYSYNNSTGKSTNLKANNTNGTRKHSWQIELQAYVLLNNTLTTYLNSVV